MKERIVLASGCNEIELLRSLAKKGINTIGLRAISNVELAKMALMRSGISITGDFLSSREEPSVIFSFLNTIDYFKSASYSDAENLALALHTIRHMVPLDEKEGLKIELMKGPFLEKNKAIYTVYEKYTDICHTQKKTDSIGIIRKAVAEAEPFEAEFYMLKEYPCTELDKALLRKVSSDTVRELSLRDLYDCKEKKTEKLSFTEAYGVINEVEDIVDRIYRNDIPIDKCTIASPGGNEYTQTFFDVCKRYDIPVTFGAGVPIVDSYPAKLLKLISKWDTLGYHGIDALKDILMDDAFDVYKLFGDDVHRNDLNEVIKMAGSLKLSFDGNENSLKISKYKKVLKDDLANAQKSGTKKKCDKAGKNLNIFGMVEKLSKELASGYIDFFDKYSVLRTGSMQRVDQSAKQVIIENLKAYTTYSDESSINTIVPQILGKTVCSENSKEGHLHLTNITGAMASLRPYLYICGLSANTFPGFPTENYLLLDEDLDAFNAADAPTSGNRILQKKEDLDNLIDIASGSGSTISLSYSGFGLSDLKDRNPSSVLFEYYEKENPGRTMDDFGKDIRKVGYFENGIDLTHKIGKEYIAGKELLIDEKEEKTEDYSKYLDKPWSPSALDIYFQCPRRFFLTRIKGIKEDNPDNPFEVIPAIDYGNLAHSLMEELANNRIAKEQFLDMCSRAFDSFLISRPPVHKDAADKEKKSFISTMDTAYDQEISISNEVLAAEEEYVFDHPSGVKLHGYPDRVEKDKNGEYLIADFKTKKKVDHVENDINTCLQVVIYAWLCEQAGFDIKRCDYRYLRLKKVISCEYNDMMKAQLNEMLDKFKNSLMTGDFPGAANNTNCKYCKLKDICDAYTRTVNKEADNEDE